MKILFLLAATLASALQVTDNFDSASGSWNTIFGTVQVQGGKLLVTSDSSPQFGWSVNTAQDFGDFELSIDAASANDTAIWGVSFRVQGNTDCYRFYIYPGGYFLVDRYLAAKPITIFPALKSNSFIHNRNNLVKIVARGSSFSFLCNGQLLYSFRDTVIASAGKLGLFVQGKRQTVAFDNFSANDAPGPAAGLSSFSDDFADGELSGWRNYGEGTFTATGGILDARGIGTGTFSILHSDGNYGQNDTLEVLAEKVSGGSTWGYGLKFHYASVLVDSNTLRNVGYIFTILSGNYFTVLKLSTSAVQTLFSPEQSISINQTVNTMKVISRAGGQMDLFVNGTKVKTVTDTEFPSGGAGLMVQGDLVMKFDNFKVNGVAPVSVSRAPVTSVAGAFDLVVSPNPVRGLAKISLVTERGEGPIQLAVYDVSGTRVAAPAVKGPGALWNTAPHPSGIYFVRMDMGNRTLVRRVAVMR